MTPQLKRVATLFLTLALVTSVFAGAFAGSAAAITAPTVTATDDGTGATTDHTISTDYDNTDSPSLKEITLNYQAGNLSGLTASDATVSVAGTSQTVSAVSVSGETTVTVTLDSTVTLSDTETIEVTLSGVENPHNAGSYDVGVDLIDGTGTSFDSAPGTDALTIVVGDTPSVTATSDLSEGTNVTGYNGSADMAETIEVEAYTDNLEADIMTADGSRTLTTVNDVTAVSAADSGTSTPGTYQLEVNHSELRTLEMGVNEMTDLQVAVENLDAGAPANDFNATLENTDEVSQLHIAADDTRAEIEDNSISVFNRTLWDRTDAEIDDTRDVTGNTSTIYVSAENETFSDEVDAAIPDSAEAGDRLGLMMSSSVDEGLVYVFYDEPGDDVTGSEVDPVDDTYIVLNDNEPHMINLADGTTQDGGTLDVSLVANDAPSPGDLRDDLDYGWVDSFAVFQYSIPFVGAGLILIGSRRRLGGA
ncbi:DUF2808 domain-containing protein [Natrinema ejinorense]|uniref:DUF2808 domain-containing protein n=1 Tax=Natrinema ejinorense TaxID=373386 RepID=A0A2A5QPD0_9EURY|nr:DUF2808 domain-containing protein [Natrinema ejinorense]PCR88687.1 DUF2808 domain-containing protein [Natrinema ejinorense]